MQVDSHARKKPAPGRAAEADAENLAGRRTLRPARNLHERTNGLALSAAEF